MICYSCASNMHVCRFVWTVAVNTVMHKTKLITKFLSKKNANKAHLQICVPDIIVLNVDAKYQICLYICALTFFSWKKYVKAGFENIELGVASLRSIVTNFKDDSELLHIPMWVRENRSAAGNLKKGDNAPNSKLYGISVADLNERSSTAQENKKKRNVDGLLNQDENKNNFVIIRQENPPLHWRYVSICEETDVLNFCSRSLSHQNLPPSAPVVVVAGSVTWPPFLMLLKKMKVLERQFGHVAAFSLVYIAEAHASDQWFVVNLFGSSKFGNKRSYS